MGCEPKSWQMPLVVTCLGPGASPIKFSPHRRIALPLLPDLVAAVERPAADGPAARVAVVERPRLPGGEEAVVSVAAAGRRVVMLLQGRA